MQDATPTTGQTHHPTRRLALALLAALTTIGGALGLTGCGARASASQVDAEVWANLGNAVVRTGVHRGIDRTTYSYRAPDGIEFTCATWYGSGEGEDLSWGPRISCTYVSTWVTANWDALTATLPDGITTPRTAPADLSLDISRLSDAQALVPVLATILNTTTIPLAVGHTWRWQAPSYYLFASGDILTLTTVDLRTPTDPPADAGSLASRIVPKYVDAIRWAGSGAKDPTVTDAVLAAWPPEGVGLTYQGARVGTGLEREPIAGTTGLRPEDYAFFDQFNVCNPIEPQNSDPSWLPNSVGLADWVEQLGGTFQAQSAWPSCTAEWTLAGHTWQATATAGTSGASQVSNPPIIQTTVTRDGQALDLHPVPSDDFFLGWSWSVIDLEQLLSVTITVDNLTASATLTFVP